MNLAILAKISLSSINNLIIEVIRQIFKAKTQIKKTRERYKRR